jgi:uncharacterized repeat protein (TIGR03847 family)
MSDVNLDFNPTEFLILSAIGKPGNRTFFLRGGNKDLTITLRIEKFQVQMLAAGAAYFLADLKNRFPELDEPVGTYDESLMVLEPPIDPLFQVVEMSMGYDIENDLGVLIFESPKAEDAAEAPGVVRFGANARSLPAGCWARELVSRGRPALDDPASIEPPDGGCCRAITGTNTNSFMDKSRCCARSNTGRSAFWVSSRAVPTSPFWSNVQRTAKACRRSINPRAGSSPCGLCPGNAAQTGNCRLAALPNLGLGLRSADRPPH